MKSHLLLPLLLLLAVSACRQNPAPPTSTAPAAAPTNRTNVIAGRPVIQRMAEEVTMNAITSYTTRENIRATVTGYVEHTAIARGQSLTAGTEAFRLKTKEAEALGEELLSDPAINITGIIPVKVKTAGIVTQVFFADGDYVVDGDILAELTKPSSLAVTLYVPYEYNKLVSSGKRVTVRLPDGERLDGRVRQLLPTEDANSQTTPYLVSLSSVRFLPENLNVTVTIPTSVQPNALVVPRAAVQSNEEQTEFWVMQIISDTLAVRQNVALGMRNDSLTELRNTTLTPADRIVVTGAYGLADTATITLVSEL